MIKACIFDLDGTLSDTLSSIAFSGNTSLIKEGLKPLPKENYNYYAGNGAAELVRRYLADTEPVCNAGQSFGIKANAAMGDANAAMGDANADAAELNADVAELNVGALCHDPHREEDFEYYFESYMREFSKYCMHEVRPFDGIPELLRELKGRGIKLGVLSNKPDTQAVEVVGSLFEVGMFDAVYGQRPEVRRKPAPDGALLIAEEFGVRPEECLYFGDTDTDMLTGKSAGMLTVGVLWGFRDRAELESNGADIIISSPEEIMAYI